MPKKIARTSSSKPTSRVFDGPTSIAAPEPRPRDKPKDKPKDEPKDPTILDDIARAIDRLSEAGQLLRNRLDAIDPVEHPARWGGVNDEIRALDARIGRLRDDQQRAALATAELRPLGIAELEALRAATTILADLVAAAARIAAIAEAAAQLADATGAALQRLRRA